MTAPWNNGTECYRFAESRDLSNFGTMLSDPLVGRWLWFTPAPAEMFEGYFAPLVDTQSSQLKVGETPSTAVFVVEDVKGVFLGQGAVVAVEGSPGGTEIGFQLQSAAWGRGVGTRLAQFLCAYAVHRCQAYRIEGACLEGNAGSRAILLKLGLGLEGTRLDYRERDSVRHTEVLYGARVQDLDVDFIRKTASKYGLL